MGPEIEMVTILGHTAGGKTALAAQVAHAIDSEVISADSRQVYRGMNIGTGKDYEDYTVNGRQIPSHLIDIADAGDEYNVYEFQKDFLEAFRNIRERGKLPVLCGGTGLYLESVLRQYAMIRVPVNTNLREDLATKTLNELAGILKSYGPLHNQTDTESVKRAVRAIEIAEYMKTIGNVKPVIPPIKTSVFGVNYEREIRRRRITQRLKERIDQGMIEEVKELVNKGVDYSKLEYYGLEYKFVAAYLRGTLTKEEMFGRLNTAIHRFAKRQMTYFRGMERRGIFIHWIQGSKSMEEKLAEIWSRIEKAI